MSDASSSDGEFKFAMGEFEARFPTDRQYVRNHMWAMRRTDGEVYRFGLTAYAVRLLQDVYFLDWIVEPGQAIKERRHIGSIESKKAESDLYAPAAGAMNQINLSLLDDPSLINADTYDGGWMFEMRVDDASVFLDPTGYAEHLEKAWVVAQRTIKGQTNS